MSKYLTIPATIDECIDLAAEHLPDGFEVIITVRKDGYDVVLNDCSGDEESLDGGDGMRSDIIEGINKSNGFEE